MSITFAAFGILNLLLARAKDFPAPLLNVLIWINVIRVAAFTALCAFYRIPPPLISGGVMELPLILTLLVK